MSQPEVMTSLKADELTMLKLMRQEGAPDVDFAVCRRDGQVVNVKKTVVHVKEFKKDRLKEVLSDNGKTGGG